jgi:hypothetical protein
VAGLIPLCKDTRFLVELKKKKGGIALAVDKIFRL